MRKPTLEEWMQCVPADRDVAEIHKRLMKDTPFDYYEYKVATHFLPALINGDDSGLDTHDFESLEMWLTTVPSDGHWGVIYHGGDFTVCDISELFADCARVRRYLKKESNDE